MSNFYEPDTKFNKIFMFIGNTITIFTGISALISWFIRAIAKKISNLPEIIVIIITFILHFCVVAFIIGLMCLLIRIVYVAFKYKSESIYIQRKITEFLHQHLIHKVRNNIVELEPLYDKLQKYSKDNNNDAISQCYEVAINELKKNLKNYIDDLAKYLTNYRGTTISVCIKIFKERDRNRDEFQSEEIVSLVRSSNTEVTRTNSDKNFVGQNTDFTNLCKGQIVFFGSANLQKIEESGQYINDSINWKEKKYTSTLVTPIRYYDNDIYNMRNKNINPDIIGFLCIDSEDEIKEWEYSDSFELQMLAAFSDVLYVYIKEFYKCFENTGYHINN